MKLSWNVLGMVVLGLGLVGCGSTVGDACTTDGECGDKGICINRDVTPGGYCSQACVPGKDDTCPTGSTCVSKGATDDVSACFLKCSSADDCRAGYRCVGVKGNPNAICIVEG
ncbi:hypothetical protein F0U61_14245 [Archangium violaceum]|uniref:hypothetical protein n=1 Tax=Archangium violaceum TaxID=83451 RepID=UPI002B30575C|nr:hypothetical protein F0U61_14245 [Archangium violaceum]